MKVRNIFKKFVNPLYLLRKSELGGTNKFVYLYVTGNPMATVQPQTDNDKNEPTDRHNHTKLTP
jgi:hypothetical protein